MESRLRYPWFLGVVQGLLGSWVKSILVVHSQTSLIQDLMGRLLEAERQLQQIFDWLPHQKRVRDFVWSICFGLGQISSVSPTQESGSSRHWSSSVLCLPHRLISFWVMTSVDVHEKRWISFLWNHEPAMLSHNGRKKIQVVIRKATCPLCELSVTLFVLMCY